MSEWSIEEALRAIRQLEEDEAIAKVLEETEAEEEEAAESEGVAQVTVKVEDVAAFDDGQASFNMNFEDKDEEDNNQMVPFALPVTQKQEEVEEENEEPMNEKNFTVEDDAALALALQLEWQEQGEAEEIKISEDFFNPPHKKPLEKTVTATAAANSLMTPPPTPTQVQQRVSLVNSEEKTHEKSITTPSRHAGLKRSLSHEEDQEEAVAGSSSSSSSSTTPTVARTEKRLKIEKDEDENDFTWLSQFFEFPVVSDFDFAKALQMQMELEEETRMKEDRKLALSFVERIEEIDEDRKLAQMLNDEETAKLLDEEERRAAAKVGKKPAQENSIIFRRSLSLKNGKFQADEGEMDDEDHNLLQLAQAHFNKAAGNLNPRIRMKKLEYVVNTTLHDRYNNKLEEFKSKGYPTDEIYVFHGTADQNMEKILKEGFKIGGVKGHAVAHGAAMGVGVYTATDPSISMGYNEKNRVLLVKVLPGRRSKTVHRQRNKQLKQANCYDAGNVIVVYESEQLLPLFVVYY